MRALSRVQRVVLLRSMLRAMHDAVLETFDNFPERRGEFIEEIRAATAASVPLTMPALMI
ncbi:hypothetical protein Tcan_09216 [Toxocara canis]|uniref:Uncharacterized protein n=1 Tax=Toxocara canis TaxID=6265 RepID=A0A0B2V8X5_TOXCA|nr:hypothetical protein Tcan_09216 [Toxocara canis]